MMGHSLGEYVAACLSGVVTLEDALAIVAERGRLMQELPEGAMLAVALGHEELENFLAAPATDVQLDIASVNGPRNCVLSGTPEMIAAVQQAFAARRIATRRLSARRAFHSRLMEPVAEIVGRLFASHARTAPRIPYVANLTGEWATEADASAPYYRAQQLRQPVQFHRGVQTLASLDHAAFLEVGPGDDLTRLLKSSGTSAAKVRAVASLTGAHDVHAEERSIVTTLGTLWTYGAAVNWGSMDATEPRNRVPLPAYPFERRSHWAGSAERYHPGAHETAPPARGRDIANWLYAPAWRCVTAGSRRAHPIREGRRRCVVLHDARGPGVHLISNLRGSGADVIDVRAGARFAHHGPEAFEIRSRECGELC